MAQDRLETGWRIRADDSPWPRWLISPEARLTLAEAAQAWGQNDDITVVTVRRAD